MLDAKVGALHLALPLAISFFTFQQISYLVDSYKEGNKQYNLLNYSLFITFFPQLIAGPIVHHKEMMPQFSKVSNTFKNYENIASGVFIFSIGLFKKIILADTFAVWATAGFDHASTLNLLEAWVTSLSYTFQLYFDFSGYTDMAIGIALLFNIKLPVNFNSPYKATSIQDFWRRWHITLSRFLKNYIYIPLGGNRHGTYKTYTNLLTTFILGGLWHGASWLFVFWGALHGIALIIYHLWQRIGIRLPRYLAWFITFNFINISWIFFRSKEWDDAIRILKSMFFPEHIVIGERLHDLLSFLAPYHIEFSRVMLMTNDGKRSLGWLLVGFIMILFCKNSIEKTKDLTFNSQTIALSSITFILAIMSLSHSSEFLYFNF